MLCKVCIQVLQGIWDPAKTPRVCPMENFVPGDFSPHHKSHPQDPKHPENYIFGHHLTRESLEESARGGCVICSRFQPTEWEGEDPRFAKLGLIYYSVVQVDYWGGIHLSFTTVDRTILQETLEPIRNPIVNFSPYTGDAGTWAMIQDWLGTCIQSHSECNKKEDEDFLPPRLLCLDDASEAFHLVDGDEVDPNTRYVTLTHCYPHDDDGLKLSTSTEDMLSSQQPLSALPQTYRDAFKVVTRLGLKHLWIDRLCIVQDSHIDRSMHKDPIMKRKILANSFCGIGATGSTSASSGLFVHRDPDLIKPFLFDFPIDSDDTMVPHKFSNSEQERIRPFKQEPLHQSARGMHDRLLIPRMIHFGSQMVHWECHNLHCNELCPSFKDGIYLDSVGVVGGTNYDGKPLRKMWKPLIDVPIDQKHESPIDQIAYCWLCFVEEYSHLQVSRGEKLLLLENLVLEMKHLLVEQGCEDTEYLAGMWKVLLPATLPWSTHAPMKKRSTATYTPTWSWASVRRVVICSTMGRPWNRVNVCELVNTTSVLDESGVLTSASLFLKGKLFTGRLAPFPFQGGLDREMKLISLTDSDNLAGFIVTPPPERKPYDFVWRGIFDTEEDVREEVTCLPVTVNSWRNQAEVSISQAYYIAGIMISQLEDGRYIRRGMWTAELNSTEECLDAVKRLQDHELELV